MMSVYIVYFNNETEVVPLRTCENYTDAEKNFEGIAQDFVKTYYVDTDRNQKVSGFQTPPRSDGLNDTLHPVMICKYEEGKNSSISLFSAELKANIKFPFGIAFVRKRHEALVYEKICYPGKVYNSYCVKYLGRINILMQDLPEQTATIYRLKDVIDSQQNKVLKLEEEIKRLEYTNDVLERSQKELSRMIPSGYRDSSNLVIEDPRSEQNRRSNSLPVKPNEITLRRMKAEPLLKELRERFASGKIFPVIQARKASSVAKTKKRNSDRMMKKILEDLEVHLEN